MPKCDFKFIKCKDKRCDVMKPRKDMENHVQQGCEWRDVSCSHCQEKYPFCELKVAFLHCFSMFTP
jgi:hypothetical protein